MANKWNQLLSWLRNVAQSESNRIQLLRPLNPPKKNRPFTVIVEGNIGSGKTTFLDYFAKFKDVEVLQEPVNKWRNVQGHNLLDLLYKDPSRWSLAFQTQVQLTMVDFHTQETSARVKLMERSIFSGRFCFIENLYQSKIMEPAEYSVLSEWFKWITSNLDVNVDLIIYLRTSPEVVHQRISNRARKEEKTVPLSYLQDLHKIHEDWLHNQTTHFVPAPVIEIDANADLPEMLEQISKVEEQILNRKKIKYPETTFPSKLPLPSYQ